MPSMVIVPFVDADEVVAVDLANKLYNPSGTPEESLSLVNGGIDPFNLAQDSIKREHTQRGTHVQGLSVSGTANLDFRSHWFSDYDSPTLEFDEDVEEIGSAKPIPGACITIQTRGTQLVRFSWTISWTNNSSATVANRTHIFFKLTSSNATMVELDGSGIAGQVREVNKAFRVTIPPAHEGWRKNRTWSGCYQHVMSVGDHTGGLYILQDNDIRQARVWARCMNAVRLGP